MLNYQRVGIPKKPVDEVVPIFHMPMKLADFWAVLAELGPGLEPTGDGGVDFSLLGHVFLFSGTFLRVENHHIFDGKNNYNGPFYGDDQ